jgi:hypothetical protein
VWCAAGGVNLSFTTNERNHAEAWNTFTWRSCWPRRGPTPSPAVKPPSATPCCGTGRARQIAELSAAHQSAYNAGRHAEVIRITVQLNAARGLQPKRLPDLRDDVQRDHDDAHQNDDWGAR